MILTSKSIMNRILITLCMVFTVVTFAHSGEMYSCVDRDGHPIVTSFPQDGMKNCVLKDSFEDQSPQGENTTEEKDNTTEKKEDENTELQQRIVRCMNCCSEKQAVCYNYTANERLCVSGKQSCIETCNSKGTSPSSWSECWSQSEKQANKD